ncbi:hypothetical protein NQ314_015167 [Rhamnusium bicolor]|uniref:Uncharacterized protein n=1 Tax=Rhamnusium bicolor TaxID=1586634 RepID=A0AAV8WYU5_9CUCU|nr:hypothetical protein NQ314_015167 [Rhamnusium bicolor]
MFIFKFLFKGNGQIVYTDVEGQLGIISGAVKNSSQEVDSEPMEDGVCPEYDVDFGNVQFEDDDEDNENAVSVEKLKKQYMGSPEPELQNLEDGRSRNKNIALANLKQFYICWVKLVITTRDVRIYLSLKTTKTKFTVSECLFNTDML